MQNTLIAVPQGIAYDAVLEAATLDIDVRFDMNAPDAGSYHPTTRTIRVRDGDRTYIRSTVAFQLAHAVLDYPTTEQAVVFAAERLIDPDDFVAVTAATPHPALWARVLRVRDCLLEVYLGHLFSPVAVA
ncbi:hypothetical protein [Microbacterium caowuchunii]|uniref:Uncharacterized protein n=1 Tax=Microbacterium caowuchunii TaxID=2614638 RepID=A0A5N0TF84_9MICO|nr:hypothetical protein [Microbacterium caowuchunii]KAA9133725.1 hypothetical protein F6B40_08205 [Microbacterium caowuchunii]